LRGTSAAALRREDLADEVEEIEKEEPSEMRA